METNAHTGRFYTAECASNEEKMVCAVLNCCICCAKKECFSPWASPAVEKTKLWGAVLRFGPAGVALCKQVLSQDSSASWWLTNLKIYCFWSNLHLLNCITQLQRSSQCVCVFVWIALPCIVEFLESTEKKLNTRLCLHPSKHSWSRVPTSPLSVWTLLPRISLVKQTMRVNTEAVASLCWTVQGNYWFRAQGFSIELCLVCALSLKCSCQRQK